MANYIVRRFLIAILTIWAVSVISFVIIQLPPGDYITNYIESMRQMGGTIGKETGAQLREMYGLDRPMHVQYWKWITNVAQGAPGAWAVHNEVGADYEAQMTAERKLRKEDQWGRVRLEWVNERGRTNDFWDCEVMQLAMAHYFNLLQRARTKGTQHTPQIVRRSTEHIRTRRNPLFLSGTAWRR